MGESRRLPELVKSKNRLWKVVEGYKQRVVSVELTALCFS